jgi:hypothetical protein
MIRTILSLPLLVLLTATAGAQEPDRPYSRVGNWQISTARWGIGCVAILHYDPAHDYHFVAIGGERKNSLSLVVDADIKVFGVLSSEEVDVGQMEMVLGSQRWGANDLKSYGYRGAHGLEITVDKTVLKALKAASTLKITRRGYVQLVIDLGKIKDTVKQLTDCISRTR